MSQPMRLADGVLTPRFPEIGRIRCGDKATYTKQDGTQGSRPQKLDKFRLTSGALDALNRVADVYGGEPRPWEDAPSGRQFQLYISSETLDVLVPPGQVLTQAFELWSGGGCQRRCNGLAMDDGQACPCAIEFPEMDARKEAAQKGRACKLTTRLSLWLPKVPGLSMWRLESHGYYAASELPGIADLLSAATESHKPIPATLRLVPRTDKGPDGKKRDWFVPQLDPTMSVPEVFGVLSGRVEAPALVGPVNAPAIGTATTPALNAPSTSAANAPTPPRPKALTAPEAGTDVVPSSWVGAATKRATVAGMDDDMIAGLVAHVTNGRASALGGLAKSEAASWDALVKSIGDGSATVIAGEAGWSVQQVAR